MHFSFFYLNLSELVQCGKSLLLLGALWMHCWRISSSCFIQFVYLGTAMWGKHEAVGSTTRFNSNLSPSELKKNTDVLFSEKEGQEKVPLYTCCSWDVLLSTTVFSFWGSSCSLGYRYCLHHAGGKYEVLLLDAIRTGLKVNQILLPCGWNTGITLLPASGKGCRIVPWAEAWAVTAALHRGWQMCCRCCICRHSEFTVIS